MKTALIGALGAMVMMAGTAQACEEMTGEKVVQARAEFSVRGFSYWSDASTVTLEWSTGKLAGKATPDQNGEWSVVLVAPAEPGTFVLTARQDRPDSAPVTLTVEVVEPQKLTSLTIAR